MPSISRRKFLWVRIGMLGDFQNILVVKLSSMGDVLHALPAVQAIRERFPSARLSWVIDQRFVNLVKGHQAIDEWVVLGAPSWGDRLPFASHLVRGAYHYGGMPALRAKKYDLVVDFQGLLRTGILCAWTNARTRVGFSNAREGATLFYTDLVSAPYRWHAVRRYLEMAKSLGCSINSPRFRLPIDDHARLEWKSLQQRLGLREGGYAVIAPMSSRAEKNWTRSGFMDLSDHLIGHHSLDVVLIGGRSEESFCRSIAEQVGPRCHVLAGASLAMVKALLVEAKIVVGLDSGPVHLAAALDRRVISIFGPTEPGRFAPWGSEDLVVRQNENCRACQWALKIARSIPFLPHTCLAQLPLGRVLNVVDDELDRRAKAA